MTKMKTLNSKYQPLLYLLKRFNLDIKYRILHCRTETLINSTILDPLSLNVSDPTTHRFSEVKSETVIVLEN